MCTEQYCVHDRIVDVSYDDLLLVLARADAFTEWDQATWKARNRLVVALGLEEDYDDLS